MKLYIVTDMEGSCGILDHDNWVVPTGRYYDEGRRLLTLEVNAAVEGFFSAGATEIHVLDGHGAGGIDQSLLDSRTLFIKNTASFPHLLDSSFDAIAWVGQHAKAGTEFAHIAHTQWFDYLDLSINGISIGEFGQMAMIAASFGVRAIFGAGDEAFCREAEALVKGIETVSVKRGLTPGRGDEYDCEGYRNRNLAAVHLHPEKARDLIREGAKKALERLKAERDSYRFVSIRPPYVKLARFRSNGKEPAFETQQSHPDDINELFRRDDRKT